MIKFFSHWNTDKSIWQSNYEHLGAWACVRGRDPWPTQQFFSTLECLVNGPNHFTVENYTSDSDHGYYVIYYGNSNYLCEHYGMAFLDPSVVDKINAGTMKLLVAFVHETFDNEVSMSEWFWTFCTMLTRVGIKRTNSVIFFTSTRSWGPMHSGEERASVVYYPWFEAELLTSLKRCVQAPPVIDLSIKDRFYLNLNLGVRPHRYLMVQYLYLKNLIEHGHVSWLNAERKNWNEILGTYKYGLRGQLTSTEHADLFHWVKQFKLSPMTLDREAGQDISVDPGRDTWTGAHEFYSRSRTELINETHFELYGNSFLTEKSFKSIFHGLPYIILGPQRQLKAIKELGYHSFPDLWDESYDELPATVHKIKYIGEQINNLCHWADRIDKLNSEEVQQRVRENQQIFFNRPHAQLIHDQLLKAWHA